MKFKLLGRYVVMADGHFEERRRERRKDRPSLSPCSALDVTRGVFRRGSRDSTTGISEEGFSLPPLAEPLQSPKLIPVSPRRLEMDLADQELEMKMAFYDGTTALLRDRIRERSPTAFSMPRTGTGGIEDNHAAKTGETMRPHRRRSNSAPLTVLAGPILALRKEQGRSDRRGEGEEEEEFREEEEEEEEEEAEEDPDDECDGMIFQLDDDDILERCASSPS